MSSYEKAMEAEIKHSVDFQEKVGLDLFVHGEPERNDMVQYFGEQLTGFIFTQVRIVRQGFWLNYSSAGFNPTAPVTCDPLLSSLTSLDLTR